MADLLQSAASAKHDTSLVQLYCDIGDEYYRSHNDFPKAKEYYFKAKELSETIHWNKGCYLSARGLANILIYEGLMDSSIVILGQALELVKKEGNEQWMANICISLGNSYVLKEWCTTALEYYRQAISFFEKNDPFRLAHLLNMIGVAYFRMDMFHEADIYAQKSLEIFGEKPDTLPRHSALINYALVLIKLNQLEQAESCLKEAQRICELHHHKHGLLYVFCNLPEVALRQYDLDKAEMYIRQTMEINLEIGHVEAHCISHIDYAYVEMYRGRFNQSEQYAQEALKTAIEYNLSESEMRCYQQLSYLAAARHDFRTQRLYEQKIDSIQSVLMFQKTAIHVKELEAKYEAEKKEQEIGRQQLLISKYNLQRGVLMGGILLSVVILALLGFLLQQRNRRNHILAQINATKDKFFNIISHDLKNPAITQRNALQMLVQNGRSWSADTLSDYYNELLKSAEGEVALVNNLLEWARIQTGRMPYKPQPFNLVVCLNNDISLVRRMAENKGIVFVANVPEDVQVVGDSKMISAVVRNLLTNAIKFTPAGGTVELGISTAATTTISVTDTGIGMTQDQINNLFSIDNPHLNQGTANEQGSGLGLIVCKELLERHKTALHIESQEGKGSRFWFEILSS